MCKRSKYPLVLVLFHGGRRSMREGPRAQRETLYSRASRTMGLSGNQKMMLLSWKNMMKVWSHSDERIWSECEATLMKNMMKMWSYSDERILWKCEATLMKEYYENVKLLWWKNTMQVWSDSDVEYDESVKLLRWRIWWKCEATPMKNMMKVRSYSDEEYDESVKLLWWKNMMKVRSYSDEEYDESAKLLRWRIWWMCEATWM